MDWENICSKWSKMAGRMQRDFQRSHSSSLKDKPTKGEDLIGVSSQELSRWTTDGGAEAIEVKTAELTGRGD